MVAVADPCSVSVHVRRSAKDTELVCPWVDVDVGLLSSAVPWRTFRWHKGQKHYSGSFWSATENDLVIYESRLELARLLFADFDVSVRRIIAQPFLLRADVDGGLHKHIPDYLLLTDAGPVVVDVKPQHRVAKPENAFTFAWTKRAVESRGWRYEVWSEPPQAELENIRFLAGYRRAWLVDQEVLDELCATDLVGATLGTAFRALPKRPKALVRSAVLHLLWQQHFTVDLTRPLSLGHVLRRS
ncbi:TnsA-like heteromeric transposase endonuclease subunit [Amycolatopsis anabasis]|uniref:TnsA-like heteromeric transposase endonuclease subunit n=1 Tax=Amycolatopsis anabasis TaxID=1840409 RepID=UPI001C55067B|nr:TnsA-like heteromeric transposase endonuclease subunit [Amycolatopsis anabasis]